MLPLTIWMNYPSFHQDDLFTSLAGSVTSEAARAAAASRSTAASSSRQLYTRMRISGTAALPRTGMVRGGK